jgi:hypothetical protein
MTTLHLSKKTLFRLLNYRPHPGQVLVHRSTASRRILACGARWGKSTLGAMEAVAALMQPKDASIGWLVAPNFDVTGRIFEPVVQTLERHFPHHIRAISPRERKIVVTNLGGGVSELRAKSGDTPNSLLGAGLDWLVVDEAARLRPEIWSAYLSQRLIDRRGWALLISTPNGCNWFRELFKRGQGGRDSDFESWSSPSWDNPHVPRALIEAERARVGPEVFDQEFGGKFAGEEDEPCELCLGPTEGVGRLLMLGDDEPIPTCKLCGEAVDHQGRSIVMKRPHRPYPTGLTRVCTAPGDEHLLEQIKRDFNAPALEAVAGA